MRERRLIQLIAALVLGAWFKNRASSHRPVAAAPTPQREPQSPGKDTAPSPRRGRTAQLVVATVTVALGGAITIGTLLAGSRSLAVDDVPVVGARGLTVLGPALHPSSSGLVVGTTVEVLTCDDPVKVTVTVEGTAEYWRANRASVPATHASFVLAVADPAIADVRGGVAPNDTDPAILPIAAYVAESANGMRHLTVTRNAEVTAVRAEVPGWRDSWSTVFVRFSARWIDRRSRDSCYVTLPALVGTSAMGAIDDARKATSFAGRPRGAALAISRDERYERSATTLAYNALTVYGGRLDPEDSVPSPTRTGRTSVWQCRERFPTSRKLDIERLARDLPSKVVEPLPGLVVNTRGPGGVAFRESAYERGTYNSEGCNAVATVNESGGSTARDLNLLWLGAVLGLGLALLVQGVLAALQSSLDVPRG